MRGTREAACERASEHARSTEERKSHHPWTTWKRITSDRARGPSNPDSSRLRLSDTSTAEENNQSPRVGGSRARKVINSECSLRGLTSAGKRAEKSELARRLTPRDLVAEDLLCRGGIFIRGEDLYLHRRLGFVLNVVDAFGNTYSAAMADDRPYFASNIYLEPGSACNCTTPLFTSLAR